MSKKNKNKNKNNNGSAPAVPSPDKTEAAPAEDTAAVTSDEEQFADSTEVSSNNEQSDTPDVLSEDEEQSDDPDEISVDDEQYEEPDVIYTDDEQSDNSEEEISFEIPASDNADKKPVGKKSSPAENELKAEKKKYARRKLKYGSAAAAITVIVVAVVVLANVVLSLLADRINMSIDITPDGTFEISQESIDYLASVNEPVEIVCMADETRFSTASNVYYKQAYEVLKKYTYYSDDVSLKFVNMTKDPTYASRYSEQYKGDIDEYSIVISSDKRIKVISIQDLFNTEMNYYTYSQEITSSNAEQELTSAIMYVTDPDPINAVMFNSETGGASYDNVYDMLVSNGYNVSEINPLADPIPEDTDVICISAPLNDYSEDLVQDIYDFLDNDGNLGKTLIYIADASQKETHNIDAFLAEWGIEIGEGVVGDSNSANTSKLSNYIIASYISTEDNDFAANVADATLPVISYNSRPISLAFTENGNRLAYSLLGTENTGFVLTDEMQEALQNNESIDPETGSYTTMAAARKYVFDDDNNVVYSNILAVGSSIMLSEQVTGATYYNNGDYFISALNVLTGKTSGISIVPKDLTAETFDMDGQTYNTFFTVYVIVIPLAVAVIGTVVYFKRRHK